MHCANLEGSKLYTNNGSKSELSNSKRSKWLRSLLQCGHLAAGRQWTSAVKGRHTLGERDEKPSLFVFSGRFSQPVNVRYIVLISWSQDLACSLNQILDRGFNNTCMLKTCRTCRWWHSVACVCLQSSPRTFFHKSRGRSAEFCRMTFRLSKQLSQTIFRENTTWKKVSHLWVALSILEIMDV